MSLSLADPENQALFHRIRRGSMFPQVLLATESSSGLHSGWARCCGFNLAQERLFCLPLHTHFSLEEEPQTATLVMACPEEGLSLHLWGPLSILRDPNLSSHFWQRLQPIVEALALKPEQLLELKVEALRADRFFSDVSAAAPAG
jgi:hypothetical protein